MNRLNIGVLILLNICEVKLINLCIFRTCRNISNYEQKVGMTNRKHVFCFMLCFIFFKTGWWKSKSQCKVKVLPFSIHVYLCS